MEKVYIWGAGKYGRKVLQAINTDCCRVEGFIDNDPAKHAKLFEGIKIVSFRDAAKDYNMIIISVVNYYAILYQLKMEKNVDFSKIVVFMDEKYSDNLEYMNILDQQKWKITLLEYKIGKLEQLLKVRFDNVGYEIIDKYQKGGYVYPHIADTEEAVNKIVEEKCSLVRYGDGEFEIMAGKERPIFQNYHPILAKRLLEIISSKKEKLLIAISNNYGDLDIYTEDSADGVRSYMTEEVRKFHLSVLEKDRTYYDAYMFKLYHRYKNREETCKRVPIPDRYVGQLPPAEIEEVNDIEYQSQIIEQIF